MALAALSGDEQCIIFVQLCNVLDPGVALALGSAMLLEHTAQLVHISSRYSYYLLEQLLNLTLTL